MTAPEDARGRAAGSGGPDGAWGRWPSGPDGAAAAYRGTDRGADGADRGLGGPTGPGGSGSGGGGSGRGPRGPRGRRLPPPERRRRGDLIAAAVIVVVAVLGALLVLRSGDGASTTLRTASPPLSQPELGPVPTALVEAWRAESPATAAPADPGGANGGTIGSGPIGTPAALITAGPDGEGGGVVSGHDPVTGAVAWEYRRPEELCTVGFGFGDVLAVFRTDGPTGTWCSDVAAFTPSTGARGPARTADLRPGTRLITSGAHVTATGRDVVEVWRSDLVATVEYGALPTPVQSSPQPRAGCTHGSVAAGTGVVAILEHCPNEASDRLSVIDADPAQHDKPEDRFSVLSGVTGGRLVAAGVDRTAVAAPDGTLRTWDASGQPVASFPLGPLAGATADPPGLTVGTRTAGPVLLWWTGTGTVALDAADLRPRWTIPGALGPGTLLPVADAAAPPTVLVPVPGGLAVADAATGAVRATLPVDRAGSTGPVGVAAVGTTVVEQRGSTVVALRPPG